MVGLLSFCSNLLTYLGTALLLWPFRCTKNNANSEAPFGSALVVAACTSQNPLPRCEYPGEWPWAASRTGLTLFPRGPNRCLGSDPSAGGLGVARRPPGAGAAS